MSLRVSFRESLETLLFVSAFLEDALSDPPPRMLPLVERGAVLPSGVLAACHAGTGSSNLID